MTVQIEITSSLGQSVQLVGSSLAACERTFSVFHPKAQIEAARALSGEVTAAESNLIPKIKNNSARKRAEAVYKASVAKKQSITASTLSNEGLDDDGLANLSLATVDLDNADLEGADFTNVHFARASFKNANLRNTTWNDATIVKGSFVGADLRGSNLLEVLEAQIVDLEMVVVLENQLANNRFDLSELDFSVAKRIKADDEFSEKRAQQACLAARMKDSPYLNPWNRDNFTPYQATLDKRIQELRAQYGIGMIRATCIAKLEAEEVASEERKQKKKLRKDSEIILNIVDSMFDFQQAHALAMLEAGASIDFIKKWADAHTISGKDIDAYQMWLLATDRAHGAVALSKWISDYGTNGTLERYKRDTNPLSRWNWSWAHADMVETEHETVRNHYKNQEDIKAGRRILASKAVSKKSSKIVLAAKNKTVHIATGAAVSSNALVYALIHFF